MAAVQPGAASGDGVAYAALAFAGLAGASAMILPGVSGGYLLLILGKYITILDAIDRAKTGVQNGDWSEVTASFHVLVPVGIGVAIGIVGVSNLIKILLERRRKPTLGVLMGLVLGAVIGLWPFQQGVPPQPGDIIRGRVMTPDLIAHLDSEDYPLQRFPPSAGQVAASIGLIAAGFLLTQAVALVGGADSEEGG
jgi:putative membrane protein